MIIGAPLRSLLVATVVLGSALLVGCSSAGSSQSAAASTSTIRSTVPSTTTPIDVAPGTVLPSVPDSRSPDSALVAPTGFRAVTVLVTRADGSTEQHCVWIADDEASQEQGLMGVTDPELGGRAGMVFSFPTDIRAGFWMKNTLLPLSIAWFNADGGFVSSADMQPCPAGTRICSSYSAKGPYRTAIEVPLGGLESLGLVVGSRMVIGDACDQSPLGASPAT